jgi:type I restriction enzyme, S subunit
MDDARWIPAGYKRTEVGVIPEDWKTETLEGVCILNGLVRGPFGGALKKEFFVKRGYKVYQQRNAIYRDSDLGSYFVDENKFRELQRFEVREGDFIVSCSGTIGSIYQIPAAAQPGIINQALLKITVNEEIIHDQFFLYIFAWDKFQQRIVDNTQGGAMRNLVGMKIFRGIQLPLPPLPEQRAIAEVLSDVDALIAALDRLIAKKRAIQQGAMQQLLTGQTRLPGFSEPWEVKQLGEIGALKKGRNIPKRHLSDRGKPCVLYGEIYTKYDCIAEKLSSFIPEEIASQATSIKSGDILFAGSGETAEEIGKCFAYIGDEEAYAGGDLIILTPKEGNSTFLGYHLNSSFVNKQKSDLGQGASVVHIYSSGLATLKVPFPPLPEQRAIVEVLSDMDAEIAALEARRDKTRAIKQGMMQKLLTGRIRLV